MFVSELVIQNFRGVAELVIELDRFIVLLGENNSGKTSILDALRICLDKVPAKRGYVFNLQDFMQPDKPNIKLRCTIKIPSSDARSKEISRTLGSAVSLVPGSTDKFVILEVEGTWNETTGQASHVPRFLNPQGHPLPANSIRDGLNGMAKLFSCKGLHANRSATQDFRPTAQFLAPILDQDMFDEQATEQLEQDLDDLSERLVGSSDGLKLVVEELGKLSEMVDVDDSGDAASVSPLPPSLRGLLQRTEIRLKASNGAKLPLSYHGAGTQSLATFYLFTAYTKFIRNRYQCFSVACIEEPESHLHPWAVSSFVPKVRAIGDQVIVSTHSGEFAGASELTTLRRLYNHGLKTIATQVPPGSLADDELRKLGFHILNQRGYLLLARFWLLVEGETEYHLLSPLSEDLGCSLRGSGAYVIPYANVDVTPLIKLADHLGIKWHAIADGDQAGVGYADKVKNLAGSRSVGDLLTVWQHDDIESVMWANGFQAFYEQLCPPVVLAAQAAELDPTKRQKAIIKSALKKHSKPGASELLYKEIQVRGLGSCPAEVTNCLNKVIGLIRS